MMSSHAGGLQDVGLHLYIDQLRHGEFCLVLVWDICFSLFFFGGGGSLHLTGVT